MDLAYQQSISIIVCFADCRENMGGTSEWEMEK